MSAEKELVRKLVEDLRDAVIGYGDAGPIKRYMPAYRMANIVARADAFLASVETHPAPQESGGLISVASVQSFANMVCAKLPAGWRLDLFMEWDSGCLEFTDWDGNDVPLPVDVSLDEQAAWAINYANEQEALLTTPKEGGKS